MNDREAFEARMRKASTSDLTINRFGNYRSSYVQNKWNEFKSGWQAALASQAQQKTLKVSENWREPLSADAIQRLKNLGVMDKPLPPAPEGE